ERPDLPSAAVEHAGEGNGHTPTPPRGPSRAAGRRTGADPRPRGCNRPVPAQSGLRGRARPALRPLALVRPGLPAVVAATPTPPPPPPRHRRPAHPRARRPAAGPTGRHSGTAPACPQETKPVRYTVPCPPSTNEKTPPTAVMLEAARRTEPERAWPTPPAVK